MMKAEDFMVGFMEKLNGDNFQKDNQPNNGPAMGEDFISGQLSLYANLLNSGIIDKATIGN